MLLENNSQLVKMDNKIDRGVIDFKVNFRKE